LGNGSRRPQAVPSPRRMVQRWTLRATARLGRARGDLAVEVALLLRPFAPSALRSLLGLRGLRYVLNLSVALFVLSLPLTANATSPAASLGTGATAAVAAFETPRARTESRSMFSAGRAPVTVQAEDVQPIIQYKLSKADTLASIANSFGISPEAVAFANGITDPKNLEIGRTIMIPPGDGALYTVADGDTLASVANRFKVDAKVIMEYNRLYFEPEHFAPGQLIFVRGATLPAVVYDTVDAAPERPTVITRAAQAPPLARSGRLAWPVGGYISQFFWAAHVGVDVAAAYGTGVGASADGVVVSTGWVTVGGLHVRIRHADGLETGYYHLGAVFVSPGQPVTRGHIVGTIGVTGVTSGPHVHWECRLGGRLVDCLGL